MSPVPQTEKRIGDWMQTFSGIAFYFNDPKPEDININDIAHSLSLLCRFNGQCNQFYSVGDHSLRVCHYIKSKVKHCVRGSSVSKNLAAVLGLIHDSPEAFMFDATRPLKKMLPEIKVIEDKIFDCILTKFNLKKDYEKAFVVLDDRFGSEVSIKDFIKEVDNILLRTEKRDLMSISPAPWTIDNNDKVLTERIIPYTSVETERMFLTEFYDCMKAINK